jgi:hypothetical protein
MQRSSLLRWFSVGTFLATLGQVGVARAEPQFDNDAFMQSAAERFEGQVMGYALAVAHDGVVVGSAAGGIAVDGVDSPVAIEMTAATPQNVGSTTKVVSTVALLQAFENDASATVDEWLDREIVDYMPELWRDKVLSACVPGQLCLNPKMYAVQFVTFRDLVQHKTGLADDAQIIIDGVDISKIGVTRNYVNDNIKMITYLLPYVVDPDYGEAVDELAEDLGITSVADSFFDEELAVWFGDYMQTDVFDLVQAGTSGEFELPPGLWTERLVPSCDHKQTYAGTPYFRDEDYGIEGDLPQRGDIDGDEIDDLIVWRPSTGRWYARRVDGTAITTALAYGIAANGDMPLVGDINGDGKDDYVIRRDSTAAWYAKSADGTALTTALAHGESGDIPLLGDFGGAAGEEFVLFRPSTGEWFAKKGFIAPFNGVDWGTTGDVPFVGDVNGDGRDDLIVFRPSTRRWYAKDALNGEVFASALQWGGAGDVPLVGDVSGDGAADFVVYRPSTGVWFARTASNDLLFRNVEWGPSDVSGPGDTIPLLADINGDVQDNLLLYRTGNGYWSAAGRRYAYGYGDLNDDTGNPAVSIEEPPGCYAQGGYWFSALEYAAFLAALESGALVSDEVRDLMVDDTTTNEHANDSLGWSSFTGNVQTKWPFIHGEYGTTILVGHSGANRDFRAYTVRLPDGYYAFVNVNSDTVTSSWLRDNLVGAWVDAMTAQEPGVGL